MKQLHLISKTAKLLFFFLFFSTPLIIQAQELMRANLKVVPAVGNPVLMDGNLTNYDNIYSNNVDMYDAWKMTNFGENFGILRTAQTLVVERRSIICTNDTTFFKMWNMQQRQYQLELILKNLNHPGLMAFLEDSYLGTSTNIGLNDTSRINFLVNSDPASYVQSRFRLIYSTQSFSALPIKFTSIKTHRSGNRSISVEWTMEDEEGIDNYVVEHSVDGRNFKEVIYTAPQSGSRIYKELHNDVSIDKNFYRIKGINHSRNVTYSSISRIDGIASIEDVSIYPNPVENKNLKLRINSRISGSCTIQLISNMGKVYNLNSINVVAGQNSQVLKISSIPAGMYRVKLSIGGFLHTNTIQVL